MVEIFLFCEIVSKYISVNCNFIFNSGCTSEGQETY